MPAGDLEKAKIAYQFGADACYGSTSAFSMRTREIGFDYKTLAEAINFAHSIGKKFYVTLNTYPHEFELSDIRKHAKKLIAMSPDAIILADAGIFQIVKITIDNYSSSLSRSPVKNSSRLRSNNKIEIHLSTQANTTNSESIKFWAKQGVDRFILAREVSLEEIIEIRKNVPKKIKIETFVHGAMCMSISGRCHLSNYLTGRDANRGACAQVCRWGFAVSEEKRAGQYMPVEQDEKYSYIFNAKDLNMIEHLDKLATAGIDSFKVEGRNKSIYYCAIVARAYRKAIDLICHPDSPAGEEGSRVGKILRSAQNDRIKILSKELSTVSTRGYCTGFYFGKPNDEATNYKTSRAQSKWDFVGIVKSVIPSEAEGSISGSPIKSGMTSECHYIAEGRGEIFPGNRIEIVTPDKIIKMKLNNLISAKGQLLEKINPNYKFIITCKEKIPNNSMIRIKTSNKKQP